MNDDPSKHLSAKHTSVLWQESLDALQIQSDGFYVDGTFGRGGHSRGILKALGPDGLLLAVDQDSEAAHEADRLAQLRQAEQQGQAAFKFLRARFGEAGSTIQKIGRPLNGVLLDLGVSSPQLDEAERGFSFQHAGPLDMRMDTERDEPLSEKLAGLSAEELANVLWELGEERYSRRIAAAVIEARDEGRLESTLALAEVIKKAHPKWQKGKHPATKSFLALRLWVNQELEDLQKGLTLFADLLAPGGRLAVISFHSLEDRIVKRFIRGEDQQAEEVPSWLPVLDSSSNKKGALLKGVGKAIKPTEAEAHNNIRARSAVLRVAEKVWVAE